MPNILPQISTDNCSVLLTACTSACTSQRSAGQSVPPNLLLKTRCRSQSSGALYRFRSTDASRRTFANFSVPSRLGANIDRGSLLGGYLSNCAIQLLRSYRRQASTGETHSQLDPLRRNSPYPLRAERALAPALPNQWQPNRASGHS